MEELSASQENLPVEEETSAMVTTPTAEPTASPSRPRRKRSASRELSASGEKRRELSSSSGHNTRSSLRKQASSPSLAQEKADAANSAQEPWKREVNDLWAKQLAMMREINTLKVELGRREAARQREILAMRQEVDVIKAEIFRMRQGSGLPGTGTSDKEEGQEEGGEDLASDGTAGEAEKAGDLGSSLSEDLSKSDPKL